MFAKLANLCLLVLFPISWFAPLMRAGVLPLFGTTEISVISGLRGLWSSDIVLALVVAFFALVAPMLKVIGTALLQFGLLDRRLKPLIRALARLAMADIFLVALYVVLAKNIGVGRAEPAWGLYLLTACILVGLGLSLAPERASAAESPDRTA